MIKRKILGEDNERTIYTYLRQFIPVQPGFTEEELTRYLKNDLWRFIQTVRILPDISGEILEIGSFPYYTTLLLMKYTSFEITSSNFFGHDYPYDNIHNLVTN